MYRVAGKGVLGISKICTEPPVLGQIPESMVVARGMVCVEGLAGWGMCGINKIFTEPRA